MQYIYQSPDRTRNDNLQNYLILKARKLRLGVYFEEAPARSFYKDMLKMATPAKMKSKNRGIIVAIKQKTD
jgi:hypothetical protein